MPTEVFVAGVQYDDWKGTSAADDADNFSPRTWLTDNGHADADDVLVGVAMSVGENYGQHKDPVYVEFLLVSLEGHDNIQSKLDAGDDPIEVKRVRVDMNVADFLALFKRFNVALSLKTGLGGPGVLDGREVVWLDQ